MSEHTVIAIVSALLSAGALAPIVGLVRWLQRKAHARTPAGLVEAQQAREEARQAEHWSTHDRSVAALARTRDELIEDITRLRTELEAQNVQHRSEREAWSAERAMLLGQQRLERESWAAERERFLREVEHWEARFREVLTEFETWKRSSGYPSGRPPLHLPPGT